MQSFFVNLKLIGESYLSKDIYETAQQINDSGLEVEIIEAYLDSIGYYNKDIDELLEQISDSYYGAYDSDEDFAQHILKEDGTIPENLPSCLYIDWEMTAKHLMYDYSASNGYYFRN